MYTPRVIVCVIWLIACLFVAAPAKSPAAEAVTSESSREGASQRPRLVVVVSIDQFPYEYLQRMRRGFAENGMFNRVAREGATYANCHHGHAYTLTGPGHSVLLTGAFPSTNGIIGNDWYDPATGKSVYCVSDADSPLVGVPSGDGVSPRNLLVDTVGDVLKLTTASRSKVFGVALKDRAAVLMAGHLADGAFWYDAGTGNWISSAYYGDMLHPAMRLFNESDAAEAYVGATWDLLLDADHYVDFGAGPGGSEASKPLSAGFARSLPAKPNAAYYKAMTVSPFGNDMTLSAALALADSEELGRDEHPDILAINLSSNDYVGHAFGPHSLEVQDMTFRTDRQLGAFADRVEAMLGGAPWVMFISSDHGVAPVPEYSAALGLDAGRVPLGESAKINEQIEQELVQEFGPASGGSKYVQWVDESAVYLNLEVQPASGAALSWLPTARRIAKDTLLRHPLVGVAFTRDELLAPGDSAGLAARFRHAYHARRSGDVLFAIKPYYIPTGGSRATHGSPWQYDTHVPLLAYGDGVRAGTFDRLVTPASIAPTAAALLDISPPAGCVVERLSEALGTREALRP